MFEREINALIQQIGREVLRDRSTISLTDILHHEAIPARLKPFFETEVQWWLYNERLGRGANKRFDFEAPELASLLNYLEQVQMRHARFEREEFQSVLDSAVKLTFNYLCRPQTTLRWYIFRGQPTKPLREVMLRFGAFSDYGYFFTVFSEWVDRKCAERPGFDAISSVEFERVTRRIDDQILLSCTVEDLLGIMTPLFEFIGADGRSIPIDALIIFFDDKNIRKLVDGLDLAKRRGVHGLTRDAFVQLLDEILSSNEDEPEADFSSVYQNDELDEVVRLHLQGNAETDGTFDEIGSYGDPVPQPIGAEEPLNGAVAAEPPAIVAAEPSAPIAPVPPAPVLADTVPTVVDADRERHVSQDTATDVVPQAEGLEQVEIAAADISAQAAMMEGMLDPQPEATAFDDDEEDEEDDDGEEPEERTLVHAQENEPADIFDADELLAQPMPLDGADDTDDGWLDAETAAFIAETVIVEEDEEDEDEEVDLELPEAVAAIPASAPAYPELERRVAPAPVAAPPVTIRSLHPIPIVLEEGLERKVVKKIFGRNRDDYRRVLVRISEAGDWATASSILRETFARHEVDPYSRTAIRFTDTIYGRFVPR